MLGKIPTLHYFNNKNEYSGAHYGMRYHFKMVKEKTTDENGNEQETKYLAGTIWPDPWAKEKTNPQLLRKQKFAFSEQGREDALKWLESTYRADKTMWHSCPSIMDSTPWVPEEEQPQ